MTGAGPLRWTAGGVRIELRPRRRIAPASLPQLARWPASWWVYADGDRVGTVHDVTSEGVPGARLWNHLPRPYVTPDVPYPTRQLAAEAMVRHRHLRDAADRLDRG